ncbi:Helitron helicase-like domain at N-terminus [Rhizoctonia solani]|uniref:ATP-dependent DNA helicase n=1 Tax=Rhizoctonia solani TaxID=456999 RepID=A0A8H7I8L2_9AGAM|nr:Helitron helicase-like domain at N-terminus [Rhizoctonia solani]
MQLWLRGQGKKGSVHRGKQLLRQCKPSRFKPPNVALILEEPPHAPLDPPQILGNQHVPVNIEDNQENINQEPPHNNIGQGDMHAYPQPNERPLPPAQLNEAAEERTAAKAKRNCGQQPQYAQLYLYDPHDAANLCTRNQHNAGIDPGLMRLLTGVIHESHGYAALYKQAWQRMQEQPVQTVSIVLCQQQNTDPRRYNLPTSDEIALILADNALNQQRDIVLFKHDGGFQRMSSWNPAYACLHYVLLFPKGEHGFQRHIPIQGWQWQPGLHPQAAQIVAQLDVEGHEPDDDEEDNGPAGNQRQRRSVVSEREYYAYYLFSREDPDVQTHYPGANGTFSTIFQAGRLFQQYLVDVWAIADQSRLLWLRNNQSSLRVELYSGLCDALLSDNLTCGEQMAESYQDAMAISCYLGGPQLFITMTANPKWPEIHSALLPGQTYSDRPDLITQVFELKRRQLMEDITQKGIFGKFIAHVHTIEFQKRGLPHMHLLVWLECASHILEPGDVDELICAELPIAEGPGADPALYAVVTSSMLHGPCGPDHSDAPCWDKDKKACTKGYYPLKQWNAQTIMVADSYPTTAHVVPYNPFLSKRYTCHINVETCSGIGAIKYVFNTLAAFEVLPASEVPNIVCLQVHLPEQQSVSFRAGQLIENVIAAAKDTSLTAFFKLNAHENQEVCRFANELVYQEIPNKFTWNKTTWKFSLQRFTQNNGVVRFSTGAIGQMYFVPPKRGKDSTLELFSLWCMAPLPLKASVPLKAKSFPLSKRLALHKDYWRVMRSGPDVLQKLPSIKLGGSCTPLCGHLNCLPSYGPRTAMDSPWNRPHALDEDVYDFGLYLVEVLVLETGSNMQDVNMPTCQQNWDQINQEQNRLIREQYALQDAQPEGLEDQLQQQLNNEQLAAFNQGLAKHSCTGPYALLSAQGKIVICVASSGLAALLLPGGKTSHSVFKIPIEIKEDSTCNISKRSELAALIARTDLIIWDEVPMQHRFCAEAFNHTCKDIANHPDKPFGGITVVFGGDFRQTLPVIPKGTPEQIVAACLKESPLWAGMEKMRLTCNMRLQHGDAEMAEFATWLLGIGEGLQIPQGTTSSETAFKQSMLVESRDSLINKIYGNLDQLPQLNDEYFCSCTILTPWNDDVLILNKIILRKFPGEMQIFHSADKVIYEAGVDDERLGTLSTEYLNSLNSGSIPLSDLELKEGCPVMILRNLARSQGVCNGTCGIVTRIGSRVLELWLLTGSEAGNTVFIPRISLTPQRLSLASNFPGANFQFELHLL